MSSRFALAGRKQLEVPMNSRLMAAGMIILAGAGVLPTAAQAPAEESTAALELPVRFEGNVATTGGPGPMATGRVTVTVEKWSTREERLAMLDALKKGGIDALLAEMQKHEVGYVQINDSLRWRLRIAATAQDAKGRHVRVVTDRPIAYEETRTNTRTLDYPVGVIEFTMPPDGKAGSGGLLAAAKVGFDDSGNFVIESLPSNTGPQKVFNIEIVPMKAKKGGKSKEK
jgi:hypothetical protein